MLCNPLRSDKETADFTIEQIRQPNVIESFKELSVSSELSSQPTLTSDVEKRSAAPIEALKEYSRQSDENPGR